MSLMDRTFVMIKPDAVQRNLAGKIISRFEEKGFKISAMKLMQLDWETAAEHYAEHEGKPFYSSLLEYITSGPVVVMVLEGKEVVSEVRKMVGATDPLEAAPGTIRGDYALEVGRNIIHASDSQKSAEREIDLYFTEKEITSYCKNDEKWLYE